MPYDSKEQRREERPKAEKTPEVLDVPLKNPSRIRMGTKMLYNPENKNVKNVPRRKKRLRFWMHHWMKPLFRRVMRRTKTRITIGRIKTWRTSQDGKSVWGSGRIAKAIPFYRPTKRKRLKAEIRSNLLKSLKGESRNKPSCKRPSSKDVYWTPLKRTSTRSEGSAEGITTQYEIR